MIAAWSAVHELLLVFAPLTKPHCRELTKTGSHAASSVFKEKSKTDKTNVAVSSFYYKACRTKNNEQLTMRTEATSDPQEHIAPTSLSPAFIKRMLA